MAVDNPQSNDYCGTAKIGAGSRRPFKFFNQARVHLRRLFANLCSHGNVSQYFLTLISQRNAVRERIPVFLHAGDARKTFLVSCTRAGDNFAWLQNFKISLSEFYCLLLDIKYIFPNVQRNFTYSKFSTSTSSKVINRGGQILALIL